MAKEPTCSLRLALVEDNPADVNLLLIALENRCAVEVTVLSDGQSAVEFASGVLSRDTALSFWT